MSDADSMSLPSGDVLVLTVGDAVSATGTIQPPGMRSSMPSCAKEEVAAAIRRKAATA